MPDKIDLLKQYSNKLLAATDWKCLLNNFVESIVNLIGTSQIVLVSFNAKQKVAKIEFVYGLNGYQIQAPKIQWTRDVNNWLFQGGEVLALTEEGGDQFLMMLEPEENKFFQCEIRIPLFIKKQIFGVISLGPKSFGVEYSKEDIDILHVLTNFTTLALERFFQLDEKELKPVDSHSKSQFHAKSKPQPAQIKITRMNNSCELLGASSSIYKIKEIIDRVASNDVTVLIVGESGTGKELVAQEIHKKSCRCRFPLITMNCAALPQSLVESELFGHEKGAFTHAYSMKKGRFEVADKSSLFLDEIGEMSLETQAKLLRVLQDGTFQRIGATRTIQTDVRIIAATNKNLVEEIVNGKFRQDLFYRLNVVQIVIPPLRERKADIPLLANHFVTKYSQYYNKKIAHLSPEAIQKLVDYHFPGNVRELQNIIERAVIMEKKNVLTLDFFEVCFTKSTGFISNVPKDNVTLEELEKQHIEEILKNVHFNKSKAAKILGIARKTLREKIQKYNIQTV